MSSVKGTRLEPPGVHPGRAVYRAASPRLFQTMATRTGGRRALATYAAVVTAGSLALAGCPNHVDPDPNDTTAPVVTLDVDQLPNEPLLTVAAQPETRNGLPRTIRLGLIGVAKDPESGIASVSIQGDISTSCINQAGTLGQNRAATIFVAQPTGTTTTAAGGLPDQRVVQMTVEFPFTNCTAGFRPTGMSGDLHVEGLDGAGLTAQNADFSFTVA